MNPQNLSSKIFKDHLTMKLDPLKLFCYTVCAVHACVNCTYCNTGVEKNNDDSKRHYFSSNKHDAPGEIIRSEYCQETLQRDAWGHPTCVGQKYSYTKHDDEYLNGGDIQDVRKCAREAPVDSPEV